MFEKSGILPPYGRTFGCTAVDPALLALRLNPYGASVKVVKVDYILQLLRDAHRGVDLATVGYLPLLKIINGDLSDYTDVLVATSQHIPGGPDFRALDHGYRVLTVDPTNLSVNTPDAICSDPLTDVYNIALDDHPATQSFLRQFSGPLNLSSHFIIIFELRLALQLIEPMGQWGRTYSAASSTPLISNFFVGPSHSPNSQLYVPPYSHSPTLDHSAHLPTHQPDESSAANAIAISDPVVSTLYRSRQHGLLEEIDKLKCLSRQEIDDVYFGDSKAGVGRGRLWSQAKKYYAFQHLLLAIGVPSDKLQSLQTETVINVGGQAWFAHDIFDVFGWTLSTFHNKRRLFANACSVSGRLLNEAGAKLSGKFL